MIIAVANTKGGTGKTTTAVQLALYRQSQGHDVWLVDGDEQQSALTAVSIRSENNVKPDLACSAYSNARTLKSQIEAQVNKWEDIIIDVGGRDTGALRAALLVCDLLLVPVQPRSYDVWALAKLEDIIRDARDIGADFQAYCFLSCADSQGADNQEAASVMKECEEMKFLDRQLGRRKAFATAGGAGLSVFEMRPKDPKACAELKGLAEEVFNIQVDLQGELF